MGGEDDTGCRRVIAVPWMSIISRSSRSTGNTYPSITSITFENLFHINLNSFASSFSKYRKVPHRVYSTTATMSVLLLCVLVTLLITAVFASSPLSVTASVRGKKFEVSAETVEEFTEKVEAMAGLEAGQNSVLFRGKVLSPSDKLEEVGISSGDVLMVVKGKKQRAAMPVQDNNGSGIQGRVPRQAAGGGMGGMGGMGFPGGMPSMDSMSPEDVQQAMKAMDKLLDSEFVEEYFADEERLEVARQNMLKNLVSNSKFHVSNLRIPLFTHSIISHS